MKNKNIKEYNDEIQIKSKTKNYGVSFHAEKLTLSKLLKLINAGFCSEKAKCC